MIGDRITARLEALGLSQAELARRVKLAQPTINSLIKRNKVGSKYLHRIARELQTTPEYLAGETDDPAAGFVPGLTSEAMAAELGLVPVRELDLSLGLGLTYSDVPITDVVRYFNGSWLHEFTHAMPEQLLFVRGIGDSMMPTIHDSDVLLIDCSQQCITMTDRIWVITYNNCAVVKRLRPRADGAIEMISDNPTVSNAVAHGGKVSVKGRVVALVRKL